MAYAVTFDLLGIILLVTLPPIIIFLSIVCAYIGKTLAKTFMNERYNKVIERNNELMMENIRLNNELEDIKRRRKT